MNFDLKGFSITNQYDLQYREMCYRCRRPSVTCLCSVISSFVSPISFAILQHPAEAQNPIATARMAKLSIENSYLFVDQDFSQNSLVNELLKNDDHSHYMLYPSPTAQSLDSCFEEIITNPNKRPLFWVLDAKWKDVPKMIRLSSNIQKIPLVKFAPLVSSQFIIRKQPNSHCLSTIESIHLVIDSYCKKFNVSFQKHQGLLNVFNHLVQQQIEFAKTHQNNRHQQNKIIRHEKKQKTD